MGFGTRDITESLFGNPIGDPLSGFDGMALPRRRKTKRRSPTRRRRARVSKSRVGKRSRKRGSLRKARGGIRYTKKGQPYRIMSDGKARFIKKRR